MRIAHILPYDRAQPGGVQTHVAALSAALRALGHESVVFAPSRPLRVRLGGTRADLTLHPRDLVALHAFLRQPHDVLHIQEPLLPLAGPLALLHPRDASVVVTLHSAESAAAHAYRRTKPLARWLLERADAVICASAVAQRTAALILPLGSRVIFPCLDVAPFRAVRPDPQPNAILFVGRDEPRKGLATLLQAMERLADARLIVAGPVAAQTRAQAAARIGDRVTFLGAVPHDRLPSLMRTAACAAFPALGGEALGLVLVEAMAAGLPIAASDVPGYRIASNDGYAALLSPPGNADALGDNLQRLLGSGELRTTLRERGRFAAEHFDARLIAQQHLDLYQSLLNS